MRTTWTCIQRMFIAGAMLTCGSAAWGRTWMVGKTGTACQKPDFAIAEAIGVAFVTGDSLVNNTTRNALYPAINGDDYPDAFPPATPPGQPATTPATSKLWRKID